ncbi:MAG: hypothetical protein JWM48_2573 [Mycobacterium sp.]|nr:hypothetical protein [Mycobacterium sp.]
MAESRDFQVPPDWPRPAEGWTPPPGWQPDPSWPPAPEGWEFWADTGDNDGGPDTPLSGPERPSPAGSSPTRWYRARWFQLAAVGVACLLVGVGIAQGSKVNAKQVAAANAARDAAITSSNEKVAAANTAADNARAASQKAQSDADAALTAAKQQVAQQDAATQSQLDARAKQLDAQQVALDQRQAAVTAGEQKLASDTQVAVANTIPGDGLYKVGTDIQPGSYHAAAAASGNCYFARLASATTSDIIDNGNMSGPVSIVVKSSDAYLELSGCADFHKA